MGHAQPIATTLTDLVRLPGGKIVPLRKRFDASSPDRGFVMQANERIGKYEVADRLGKGNFGTVYRARDTDLERHVAIKLLNPTEQSNPEAVARFVQEGRAAARINHPGIVTIFEVGELARGNASVAYIVMELLEGEPLNRRVDTRGRLDANEAVDIAHQIAGALGAAHRAGVFHRDIKPDNVFLVRDPVLAIGERVKVLDFGLAKLGGNMQTNATTILGTPRYMSPEQTLSSTVDARSEVYSLGCVLFEMLTGRTPFGGDLFCLVEQHRTAIAPRVRSLAPDTDERLDALVAKMLAKDPSVRPQTMGDVQRALVAIDHHIGRSAVAVSPPVARIARQSDSVATIVEPRHVVTERTIRVRAPTTWKQRGVVAAVLAVLVTTFAIAAPSTSDPAPEPAVEVLPSVAPPPKKLASPSAPVIERAVGHEEIEIDKPPPKPPVKRSARKHRAPKWNPDTLFPSRRR